MLFKETVEAVVRTCCVYLLGAYLVSPQRSDERDEIILDLLVRPATGHWIQLLEVLCKTLRDEAAPCRGIYDVFFERKSGGQGKPGPAFQWLQTFVAFRNDLHHGIRRPEVEYERELCERLPGLAETVEGLVFLVDHPIRRGADEVWMGPEPPQCRSQGSSTSFPEDDGALHFSYPAAGGRKIDLEPFVMFLDCPDCESGRLFFYDSQKSWGTNARKKRVYMLEYAGGHRPARREPSVPLEDRFGEEMLQRCYNAFRKKMVAIERYLKNFGSIVDAHGEIIGREFVREQLHKFVENHNSGIFLLTGEPGIGTAFLANLVEAELGRVHFFYRHTSGLRNPDDCVQCLYRSLLNKYNLEPESETSDPKELRAAVQNLLPKVAGLLKPGEQEWLIVDALDEAALSSEDGATAIQVLPAELPDGVFLVLSSRPGNPHLMDLRQRPDVETFLLDADSEGNKEDARRYVTGRVGDHCDEETQRRIADRAEWNFLFLTLLCDAIVEDGYTPGEIDDFLVRSASLQGWYAHYWRTARASLRGRTRSSQGDR